MNGIFCKYLRQSELESATLEVGRFCKTFVFFLGIIMCESIAVADTFGSGDNSFDIEFVTIANPGNQPDTMGEPDPPFPTGSLSYVYRIGKYEISREMVEKANLEGNLGLLLDPMDFVTGGPRPLMPATGLSWNEAARFVNWLNTSEGFSPAYKFSTQPGDNDYIANSNIELWAEGDPGFDSANLYRNSLANYFLPSVSEWYKAAYYDPLANGGAGGYWQYPTGSDMDPIPFASGNAPGTAIYAQETNQGPADVIQAGALSPYGVMGMGGNVREFEETDLDLLNDRPEQSHALRGGDWDDIPVSRLARLSRNLGGARTNKGRADGFRVASVIPEPTSLLLAALALAGMGLVRCRLVSALGVACVMLISTSHASAAVSVYTDEQDFLAAVQGNLQVEGFEGEPIDVQNGPRKIEFDHFSVELDGQDMLGVTNEVIGGRYPSEGQQYLAARLVNPADSITFAFPGPTFAFGFEITDLESVDLLYELSNGESGLALSLGNDGSLLFFGLISDDPFNSVKLSQPTQTHRDAVGYDKVYTLTVPEPSSLLLAALALAGVGVVERWHRQPVRVCFLHFQNSLR